MKKLVRLVMVVASIDAMALACFSIRFTVTHQCETVLGIAWACIGLFCTALFAWHAKTL